MFKNKKQGDDQNGDKKEWLEQRNRIIKRSYNDYGLTQREIAEIVGIDQSTVSRILKKQAL